MLILVPPCTTAGPTRCTWEPWRELMLRYHDTEWGVPSHDDRHLFEMLLLEGAQAGLSWAIILRKRESYRAAFAGFDPRKIARYDARQVARLLRDPGIVRNRLKVHAAIANARAVLAVQKEFGSFAAYLWPFTDGRALQHRLRNTAQIPVRSAE